MNVRTWIIAGAVLIGVATPGWAEHPSGSEHPAGTDAAQQAMMEAWAKAAAPGPEHEAMAGMAGTWTTVVKNFMDPSAPPMESKGTAEFAMELGGRYMVQRFHGEMMGQPFEGLGYDGFDNVTKTYRSIWMDSMSTGIMVMNGKADPASTSIKYTGSMTDAASGADIPMESVITFIDKDHQKMEMWQPGPDGKMVKSMEILYSRKK